MNVITKVPLEIDREELVLIIRGSLKSKLSTRLIEDNLDLFQELEQLAHPTAVYELFKVHKTEANSLYLEGKAEPFTSKLFPLLMPGARHVAFGLVTIGELVEEAVSAYMDKMKYTRGLILDGLGTLALEKTSLHLYDLLKDEAEKLGLQASTPISPGQIDWDIKDQASLFRLLKGDEYGIKLLESNLLIPKKSLALAVGFGTEMETKKRVCHYCPLKATCPSRLIQDHRSSKADKPDQSQELD